MYFDKTPQQEKRYQVTLEAVHAALDGSERPAGSEFFTREEWRTAGRLGLLGLCVPAAYGGGGLGAVDTALQVEAFGRGCTDMGLVFSVSAHLFACAVPVAAFAEEETRARLLPPMCAGDLVAANAMTESAAGSDVAKLTTTARREGDEYVLNGVKSFASNAPAADVFVTYAVTDPAAGHLGNTAFVVERSAQGLEVGLPFRKMGLTSCPAATVGFSMVRVPRSGRLGSEGQGGAVFQHSMGWERACLFSGYLGMMDRVLERCVAHLNSRRQFGRRLSAFQALSHRLADLRMQVEAARLLLYRACWLMDQGRDSQLATALSKLAVSQAAVRTGIEAVQLFGGAGYLTDTGMETVLRDSVPSTLFSGTSEIQRELIARGMGL